MSTIRKHSAKKHAAQAGSRPPKRARVRLYATALPGLEAVLAEELSADPGTADVEAHRGTVVFERTMPIPLPVRVLAADALSLLVREAHGDFAGPHGLRALCGKLARTEFDRSLGLLSDLGRTAPRNFMLAAQVASGCGFMFFDVNRQATPVLARRLGIPKSDGQADLVVDLQCLPDVVRIGVRLPLVMWSRPSTAALPRSLVGSLVRLADVTPQLTLCDPDCGPGELLSACEKVIGARRIVGFDFAGRPVHPMGPPRWLVRASTRHLPIADARLSRMLSALPQVRTPAEFAKLVGETGRCLAPNGRAAFAVPAGEPFNSAITAHPRLRLEREVRLRQERQAGRIIVLVRQKASSRHRVPMTAGDRARATSKLGGVKSRAKSRPRPPRPRRPRSPRRPEPGRG